LEAAKSITNAASVLIKAATAAQKELIVQGKVKLKIILEGLILFTNIDVPKIVSPI
jgi:hypothetical protein